MSKPVVSTTRIWDPTIRLFHWLLVALIAFSWWSGEQHDMDNHRLSGYAILALLVFRVFWGFAGPRTARFSSFVRGPGAVLAYVKGLGSRKGHLADGHNPLGGWSVIAMLAVIALMVGERASSRAMSTASNPARSPRTSRSNRARPPPTCTKPCSTASSCWWACMCWPWRSTSCGSGRTSCAR